VQELAAGTPAGFDDHGAGGPGRLGVNLEVEKMAQHVVLLSYPFVLQASITPIPETHRRPTDEFRRVV
jgi:hypothetical protein